MKDQIIIYSAVFFSVWILVRKKFNRIQRMLWIEKIARYLLQHHKVKWAFWVRRLGMRK